MYTECITCPKLGVYCDGPNFVAMSAIELLEWSKARKKHLGLSNAKLSELSNMPKGTIDRLFAGHHLDFKYETVRPMLKVLVGGQFNGDPCPNPEDHTAELQLENEKLKDEYKHDRDEYIEMIKVLKGQIRDIRTAVISLGVALGIALLSILFLII